MLLIDELGLKMPDEKKGYSGVGEGRSRQSLLAACLVSMTG